MTIFISLEDARQIERAEGALTRAVGRAAQAAGVPALVMDVDGGAAVHAGATSPVNKVIGAGLTGALDADAWTSLERAWPGGAVRVELASVVPPAYAAALSARGYRTDGFEHVLARRMTAVDAEAAPALDVRPSDDFDAWADIMTTAFATPDGSGAGGTETFDQTQLRDFYACFASDPAVTRYLCWRDGAPMAAASMRVSDGVALLCGAATLPAARGRGGQAALLTARLAEAAARGCTLAAVTTEPASKSQQNVTRAGFGLAYVRGILTRRDPA